VGGASDRGGTGGGVVSAGRWGFDDHTAIARQKQADEEAARYWAALHHLREAAAAISKADTYGRGLSGTVDIYIEDARRNLGAARAILENRL
jgi:hypothetical protein